MGVLTTVPTRRGGNMTAHAAAGQTDRARTRGWSLCGLILLLLLGIFYIFGAVSDLAADANRGLPVDHQGTFTALAGTSFDHLQTTTGGVAGYVTVLERGYALHELTFALFFIVILVIPFRQRHPWAWWACWILMTANLGYTFTFGIHDPTIFSRSLIADVALVLLLLAHIPAFFNRSRTRHAIQHHVGPTM